MKKINKPVLLLSILLICCLFFSGCVAKESEGQMAGVKLPDASVSTPAANDPFAVQETEWTNAFSQLATHWCDSGSIERMTIVFDRDAKSFIVVLRFPLDLAVNTFTDEKYTSLAGSICAMINDSAAAYDKSIAVSNEQNGYYGGVFDVYGANVYFALAMGDYYKCVSMEAGSQSLSVK